MSSQLQQINSPRINFISTFLSQQFGPGSGLVELGGSEPLSSLLSLPAPVCVASPFSQLDVNKKIAISKILNQKYLNKTFWPNYFPKNVISNSTIIFFGINIDLISTATVSAGCIHHVMRFFRPKQLRKTPEVITSHDLLDQKAADVWKKDVWDFQALSQTFLELRFSLGTKDKTART